MSQVVVGPVDDPATDLGSLISLGHRDNVAGMDWHDVIFTSRSHGDEHHHSRVMTA